MATSNRIAELARGEHRPTLDPLVEDRARLSEIPIERLDPDPQQPRVDLGSLEDLAASIRQHGIIQPLIVTQSSGGRFVIIAGHRRHGAALLAGVARVPAVIRTIEEQQRLAVQIVENLHRKDLNPVEEAEAFRRLMDEFRLTQRSVAERVGKSLGHINQALRLLELPANILVTEKASQTPIPKSILLEIVKRPRAEQAKLYEDARSGHLTRDGIKKDRTARRAKTQASARIMGCDWRAEVGTASLTVTRKDGKPDKKYVISILQKAIQTLKEI